MNKIFKTISNFKHGQRVVAVASELASGLGSSASVGSALGSALDMAVGVARERLVPLPLRPVALAAALAGAGMGAWALPQGGQVVHGSATITTQGQAMTVQQAAGHATINWQHFHVGSGESVRFNLANANDITLNRIGGDSLINGAVSSNGRLWFATGGNLFTVGSSGSVTAMKEVFITSQDMAVGQYTKPIGAARTGAVNVLPQGKLSARLIHIDAGSVNMSRAELIANAIDDPTARITVTGQHLAVTDSRVNAGQGQIVIGREGWASGDLAQTTDVTGSHFKAYEVETSAQWLQTSGVTVQASTWLLDPTNVTISANASSGGTMASAQGQSGASNFSTTDIQNAINAGTSVNVLATGTITQTAPLTFNVTAAGASPSLTLYNAFGAKQAITLAAITDNTTGAGSGVTVKANSAGGAITVGGAISLKGDLILDNSFAVGGGSGGGITYSNAATNATGPIAVNAAIGAASVSLTGMGFNQNGVTVGAAITARAGGIDILGVSNSTNGASGVAVNAQLRTTGASGDIDVKGVSTTANGVIVNNANILSDNGSIRLYGASVSTGAGNPSTNPLNISNSTNFVSAKQNLVLVGYGATSSNHTGVFVGGPLLAGGNISMGGYGPAGGVWLGNPGVYFAGGNLDIVGARLVDNTAILDSSAAATATAANAHGVAITSGTTATNIATGPNIGSFTGFTVTGTANVSGTNTQASGTGGYGVWIGQGGGNFRAGIWNINATNAGNTALSALLVNAGTLTSTTGALNVTASTTSTGAMSGVVSISVPINTAGGLNVNATGTTQATVASIGGAITNAAGNISVTGNNSAAGSNTGISMGSTIAQNANGGSIRFTSNNSISQTGAITLAANTSGTASSVIYDTSAGNRTSTITSGTLSLTGGISASNTDINYTVQAAGATITTAAVSVPGSITLNNTFGRSSPTALPTSDFISIANNNLGTLATTADFGVGVNGALLAGRGVTLKGVSNNSSGLAGVRLSANVSSSQLRAGHGIDISGENLLQNGVYVPNASTLQAGTATIAGGNINLLSYGSTGTSSLFGTGANLTISTFGGDVNLGTASRPIYGGAGINNVLGAITSRKVSGVGGHVAIYASGGDPSGGNAINNASPITADGNITIVGNNRSNAATGAVVSLTGAITLTNASNNSTLSITGNTATGSGYTGASPGLSVTGAIAINSNGGGASFVSNNRISQTGAITLAANTSGTVSGVTYNTTTGNKASTITTGSLILTGGVSASDTGINYSALTSGANITVNNAVSMPGTITLDNTYLNGVAFGITSTNIATHATTGQGITLGGALTAGNLSNATSAIKITGITASNYANNINGIITATKGDIYIYGQTGESSGGSGVQSNNNITANAGSIFISGSGKTTGTGNQGVNIVNGTIAASGDVTIAGYSSATTATSFVRGIQANNNTPILAGGNVKLGGMGAIYGVNVSALTVAKTGSVTVAGATLDSNGWATFDATKPATGLNSGSSGVLMQLPSTSTTISTGPVTGTFNGVWAGGSVNISASSIGGSGAYISGALTGGGITVTGSSTTGTGVDLTSTTLTNTTGNIVVTGTQSAAGGGLGISSTGAINQNANGGSTTFISNNSINQTGTLTVAANTSGNISNITYNTTTGNKLSTITPGPLVLTGGVGASNTGINYSLLASGANITVSNAIAMPGIITLNNSYLNGVDLGINSSGLATYATGSQGITVSGALTAININNLTNAINIVGVSNGDAAVNLSGNITATQGGINIQALSTGTNWYALYTSGTAAITANSGNINISGSSTSSTASGLDRILLNNTGDIVASGNISIAGNDASTIANGQRGLNIQGGVDILAGGNLTLGGTGASSGVYAQNGGLLVAKTGNLTIQGASVDSNGWAYVDATKPSSNTVATNGTSAYVSVGTASRTVSTGPVQGTFMGAWAGGSINIWGSALQGVGVGTVGNLTGGDVTLKGKTTGYSATSNNPGAWVQSGNIVSTTGAINIFGAQYGSSLGVNSAVYLQPTAMISAKTDINIAGYTPTTNQQGVNTSGTILAGGNITVGGYGGAGGIWMGNPGTVYAGGNFIAQNAALDTNNYAILASGSATATGVGHGVVLTSGTSATAVSTGPNQGSYTGFTVGGTATVAGRNNSTSTSVVNGVWLGNGGGNFKASIWDITGSNASSSSGSAVLMDAGTLTSTSGPIAMVGTTTSSSGTGVYLNNANVTASGGTYTAGSTHASDAIRITGTALAGRAAINLAGTTAITNNSTIGNTNFVANVGNFVDPVTVTNAATAGAIEVSAIGSTAAIISAAGTLYTQNSNSGIYMATSDNGNLTAPKIVNNGTGPVVLAAGAYLPVGMATGGQVIGVSGNTLTSANGNVYLYSGAPTNAASSTTATSTTQLGFMVSSLGNLSFNNTVFSQAYADTNVAAISLPNTAINIANLPSANTRTGSTAGPAIQFRVTPSYQMVLTGNLTKVYGAADPANTLNSVNTVGTLQHQLAQNFTTPATNSTRLRSNGGVTEIILSVNGTNFFIPLSTFLSSITGTRAGMGVLAGEQVYTMPTSGSFNANYGYSFSSSMGILVNSGVLLSGAVGTNPIGMSVTPAPLTVTSYGNNFTYDGVTKFGGLFTASGLVSSVNGVSTGDSVTSVTNTFRTGGVVGSGTTISNPATTVVNAGTYNGSPSAAVGTGLSNYTISYVGAAFTVSPAPLSVTGSTTSRVYTGSAQSNAAATITGLRGTESITVTGYGSGTTVAGGPYADNLQVSWGTALASNYTLTRTNGALTITAAPLTIGAAPVTTTYGSAQSLSTSGSVVATGLLGADTVSGVGFTYNSGSTVPGTLQAGTYANALVTTNATGTGLGNYSISYGTADLVVNRANLTISQTAQTLTYNATARGGAASSSLGTVSGNVVSTGINGDTFTVSGTASGTHVGTYTSSLLASGASEANYIISYANGAMTITPAVLTITAATDTKVYDGTTGSTAVPAVTGLQGLDQVTGLGQAFGSKQVLGSGNSILSVNAGYAVNDGNGGNNYTLTVNTATGTITPRPLTVSGITASSKVYDGNTMAVVTASGAQVSGVLPGDAVTASIGTVSGSFADAHAGNNKPINLAGISLSGTDAVNYTLAGVTGLAADITARPVVITGATVSQAYTAATQTNTYTVEASATGRGVVSGESITATGLASGRNVGTYSDSLVAVAGAGTELSNYSISYAPGSLTITPVTLGAVASAHHKVYDASTAATGSIALTGLLGADTGTVSAYGTFAFAQSDVGTGLPVTLTGASLTGAAAGNYLLPAIAGPSANITPAPLTLRVNNDGKLYSLIDEAGYSGYSLSGFVAGQTSSVLPSAVMNTISLTRDATVQLAGSTENAGSYAGALKALVNGSTPVGTVAAGNYALSLVPGDFTIAPQGAALIKVSNAVTYGGALVSTSLLPTVSYLTGGVATDLTLVSATASASNVNYVFRDGANNDFSFTLGSPVASSGAGKVPVGSYSTASLVSNVSSAVGAITGGASAIGSLTVTPAAASLTANAASVVYNGQTQTQTASFSGILTNDKVAYTGLASGRNVAVYASSLAVSPSSNANSADADNYTFTLLNHNLTITPYQLSLGAGTTGSPGITATANSRQYDGTLATTGTLTPVLFAGDTLTASASSASFANRHVGNGKTVTFSGVRLVGSDQTLANYSLSGSASLTATANITPAPLTITGLAATSKRYDGTQTATLDVGGASVSGVMPGDSISVSGSGANGTFASKDVGSGIAVSVSNAASALTPGAGTQLSDYSLQAVAGLSANIAPAPLTINGLVAADKVYDGGTATALSAPATASLSGVAAGETITLNATGASGVFASKNVGSGLAVSATLSGNLVTAGAGTLLSNYTLGSASISPASITPAPLTVTGVAASHKVYDGTTSVVLNTAGAALSGAVAGESLTLDTTGVGGVFATRNVANAVPVTVTGANVTASGGALLSNYSLQQPAGITANITPRPLTVTGLVANHKVYDATTAATLDTSGASVSGVVSGDQVSLLVTGASGTFADRNVGQGIAVTVSGASSTLTAGAGTLLSNYSLSPVGSLSANISPAPLTITGMTASSKVYDGSVTATLSGGSLSGVQGSDTITLNTSGTSGVFVSKDVGNAVGVSVSGSTVSAGGGTLLSNYIFSEPGTITASITPKPLTVLGITAYDKVYDGSVAASIQTASATLSGVVPGETLTLDAGAAVGSFASKNASALPQAVSVTGMALVQGGNTLLSNYSLGSVSAGNALITPAPLTVTGLVALNKVYDRSTVAQLDASAVQLSGVVAGDGVSFASGTATGTFADRNAGDGIAVSVSGASGALVVAAGTLVSNYSLNTITGLSANITPRPITATGISVASKVYDGTMAASVVQGSGVLMGVMAGDSIALDTSSAIATLASADVGSGIAVGITGAGLTASAGSLAGNYTLNQPAGLTASITPAPLVVTGASASLVYNGSTQTNAAAGVSGLMAGESLLVTGYGAGKNVGTYADVLVISAVANTRLSNYNLTQTPGSLTVTPYALGFGNGVTGPQITATATNKVYDATTGAGGTVAVTGLFAGDVLSAEASTTQFDTANVGNGKTVTLGGITLGGAAQTLANYTLSGLPTVTALADITPAPLKVRVQNDAKFVTQTDAAGSAGVSVGYNGYQISGFVGAETEAVLANPAITVSRTGIANPAVVVSGDSNELAGVYTGALTAAGPAAVGNYALTYVPGTFTIIPAGQLLVRTTGATGVYASGPVVPTITSVSYMDPGSGNAISTLTQDPQASGNGTYTYRDNASGSVSFSLVPTGVNTSTSGNARVGTYALATQGLIRSGTNLNNPDAVVTGNLQVTPKTATLTATSSSSVYRGQQTQESSFNGLVDGDVVRPTGLASGSDVGTYSSSLGVQGADAANYSFTLNNGVLTITPAALTVTGASRSATYSAAVQTNSQATVSGLVPGDALSINGYGSGTNVGTYADTLVVTAGANTRLSNYTLTATPGALTITPLQLALGGATGPRLVAAVNGKVYDGSAAATGSLSVLGLLGNDALTVSGGAGSYDSADAGQGKTVTFGGFSLAGDPTTLANYSLGNATSFATTGSIAPAALTVAGASRSVVYNAAEQTNAQATVTGLLPGDSVSVSGYGTGRNVGVYSDALTLTAGGNTRLSNYTLTTTPGALTITPAAATVTAVGSTRVFTGLDQNQTAFVTGYLDEGDALQGLGITGLVSERNVGSYRSRLLTSNDNYIVALVDSPYVILPDTPARPDSLFKVIPPVLPLRMDGPVTPAVLERGIPSSPLAIGTAGLNSTGVLTGSVAAGLPAMNAASTGATQVTLPGSGAVTSSATVAAGGGGSAAKSAGSPSATSAAAEVNRPVDAQVNRTVRNYDLVGFTAGSQDLSAEFKDLMGSLSERKVVITGYADLQEADPMGVSLRRAQLARDYLIGKGWNADNITVKAAGATDQFDRQQLLPNRRVFIQGDWPMD